jgi:hypothetical protein
VNAKCVGLIALSAVWLSAGPARAADPTPAPAAAPAPYDSPAVTPRVPVPAVPPHAVDIETPHAHVPQLSRTEIVRDDDVEGPPEPGRILGELAAGFLTTNVGLIVVGVAAPAGPLALAFFAAVPLGVGGIVCTVGGASDSYEGSCGSAIGGAYLGSLAVFPGALIGVSLVHSSGGELGGLVGLVIGAAVGYVVGTTVGAVVGWNLSRVPKARPLARGPRPDLLALSPSASWTEPLRRRGDSEAGAPPTVSVPVLSLRF